MIFQYGLEPVLIQRILVSFKATLEMLLKYHLTIKKRMIFTILNVILQLDIIFQGSAAVRQPRHSPIFKPVWII